MYRYLPLSTKNVYDKGFNLYTGGTVQAPHLLVVALSTTLGMKNAYMLSTWQDCWIYRSPWLRYGYFSTEHAPQIVSS